MIRTNYAHDVVIGECKYYELAGLSTDTKPTEKISTGSLFLEVDTGDVFAFDEASSEWKKVCALGGAGE